MAGRYGNDRAKWEGIVKRFVGSKQPLAHICTSDNKTNTATGKNRPLQNSTWIAAQHTGHWPFDSHGHSDRNRNNRTVWHIWPILWVYWACAFNPFQWKPWNDREYHPKGTQRAANCHCWKCLDSSKAWPGIKQKLPRLLQKNGTKQSDYKDRKKISQQNQICIKKQSTLCLFNCQMKQNSIKTPSKVRLLPHPCSSEPRNLLPSETAAHIL